jgi:dipeptidase
MMQEWTSAKRALLLVLSVLALIGVLPATFCEGCFSIVVGKKASADGYVLMAHNEDDAAPQIVNHHKIPRQRHAPGEKVQLRNGGVLDEVEETWACLWSEMPGMLFSDSYVNEWGVSITSDNCPSKEERPEITDGGIGYMLRRLVALRAKTAREGVLLAGKLVEQFGYIDSGRTYIICDPDEGWLFAVINGKRWIAQRVADDQVAMVANTYTIRQIDLADTARFLGSKDIIEYAESRGWYDPQKDGAFDFASVYANPISARSLSNLGRQADGLRYVSAKPVRASEKLPFSVTPRRKISAADLMQILRHDKEQANVAPSEISCPICSGTTQTSFVAQLRRGVPLDVGIVYWVCLASPRTSFYIPFHFGIADFPQGFRSTSERPSEQAYDTHVGSPFKAEALQAFWTFSNFYHKLDVAPAGLIERVKTRAVEIEKDAFSRQGAVEEAACRLYTTDKMAAAKMLADYSDGIYLSCLEAMENIMSESADEKK